MKVASCNLFVIIIRATNNTTQQAGRARNKLLHFQQTLDSKSTSNFHLGVGDIHLEQLPTLIMTIVTIITQNNYKS